MKKTDDAGDVAWIETCVVKYFCLQPLPGQGPKMFKKPQFEEEMKNFVPGDYFEVIYIESIEMVILPLLYSASSFGLPWEKTIDMFLTLEGAPYLQKKSLYLNSVSDIPHPNFFTIDLPRIRLADYETMVPSGDWTWFFYLSRPTST